MTATANVAAWLSQRRSHYRCPLNDGGDAGTLVDGNCGACAAGAQNLGLSSHTKFNITKCHNICG